MTSTPSASTPGMASTSGMATTPSIERHPDIMALRNRYEEANETWTAHITTGLVLVTGLYLAISPWVVGFQALTPLVISNVITGLVIVGLAFGLAAAYERFHGLSWVIPALGVWALVSPWVIRGGVNTTPSISNNIVVGIVCILLGAGVMFMGARAMGSAERSSGRAGRMRR